MIEIIPYAKPHIDRQDRRAVNRVLHSRWLTQGKFCAEFESRISDYVGAKYAIAFNSGTSALHAAYLTYGVKGRMVYMNPCTFVATANMAREAGARITFVDDLPSKKSYTVSMHYAGEYQGKAVIEDACHAIGSNQGSYSKIGCCHTSAMCVFSTHAVKNITTGEGGIVTTNNEAYYEQLKLLRSHGRRDGEMITQGYNYRMTDMQAALGISQLRKIDWFRNAKDEIVRLYNHAFRGTNIVIPATPLFPTHWHLYVIRTPYRDKLKKALAAEGIESAVHYPLVYQQKYWDVETICSRAEAFTKECLSLPLYVGLKRRHQDKIIEIVKRVAG